VEGRIAKSTDVTVDTGVRVLPVTPEGLAINLEEKNGKVFNLDVMVAELARRIFTDLTVGGTTRWRATYYFTEGLLDYRSCLLSRKDQLNNLRNAERRFLQAISEDGTFDLAWYNLGVVYSELKNLDAAEQAFLKAIQLNPERWEPYYALSLNRLNKIRERIIKEGAKDKSGYIELDDPVLIKIKEYELQDVIQPCRQVIELGSKNRKLSIYPNIYILTGLVYRMLALKTRLLEQEAEKFKQNVDESQNEEELRRRDTPVEDLQGDPYYYEERSLKFFRKASIDQREATRLSWRALCRCQCTSTDDGIRRESDIRYVSSTALWDLARTCFAYHEWKASITKGDIQPDFAVHFSYAPITWLLQQALFIDRTNAIVYANLGAVYCERKQFKKATNAFRLASQIDPTYPKYWVQSATSSDRAGWKNERELAIKKILEHPSWVHKNLSRRWQKRLFCVLQNAASQRSRDLFDILYFQGTFEGFEASPCPHDDAGRVNPAGDETNPRDSSDAVRFDEDACWERARRSYRAADKAVAERCGNPNEIIEAREHYKLALEALSQPKHDSNFQWKREVARRWAQGVIYNELARSTSRSDYYRESFDRLSEVHPLEIKERKIDIHLIESLLLERRGERRKFDAAFEIASRAQYRNPLGFEENFLWGRCFFATRDYKQALHHLESALLLEPFDIQTLRYIGYCYWKLGYYCQNREEKTNFWKQAIHYFDDAAKAISVEKLKHQSASSLPVRDRAEVDPLSARYDQEHFEVSLYLGDCYTGISEYGKALSHYEIAMVLAKSLTDTVPFECYCALKCAEALLHKRDHFQCELYLADIFSRFGQPPLAECEHQVTDEFFEALKDFLIRRMSCFHDSIDCAYAGEIYIRALIGQAYSYAERDTRLEVAFKLVDRAERILRLMEKDLKKGLEGLQNRENGTSPHGQGEQSEIERLHEFITSRACVLQADIHDKRGWIVFKQYKEPGNLKLARTSLHLAVALQPDPVYYYHLAIVYAALARETGKREICLRMALAYCVHALDMAPRFSLEEQVILLRGVIENHVKTLEGAFDGSLSKAYEKKKESGKEKTGIQYVFRWA